MSVNVTQESCDRCGTCIGVCPSNALMLLTDHLVIEAGNCTGCGACVAVCPFGALSLGTHAGGEAATHA